MGEADETTVVDVLEECRDRDVAGLYWYARGVVDPADLSFEEWTRPMAETDGRVCLKAGHPEMGWAYFCWLGDGTFGQKPHEFDFDRPAELPGGHLAAVINAQPVVEPVLREDTPFGEADHAE